MESTMLSMIPETVSYEAFEDAEIATIHQIRKETENFLSEENKSIKTVNELEKQRLDLAFNANNLLKNLDLHYASLVNESRNIEISNLGLAAQIIEEKANSEIFSKASMKEINDHRKQLESDEEFRRNELQKSITNQKGQLSIKRKVLKALEDKADLLVRKNKFKFALQERYPRSEQWLKLNEEYKSIMAELEKKRQETQMYSSDSDSSVFPSPKHPPIIRNVHTKLETSKSVLDPHESISLIRNENQNSNTSSSFGFSFAGAGKKKVTLQTAQAQKRIRYG